VRLAAQRYCRPTIQDPRRTRVSTAHGSRSLRQVRHAIFIVAELAAESGQDAEDFEIAG